MEGKVSKYVTDNLYQYRVSAINGCSYSNLQEVWAQMHIMHFEGIV